MDRLFERPGDLVRQSSEIYNQFDLKRKNRKDLTVADLLFVFENNGIEAVEKNSSKGKWLSFKSKVYKFFGKESELSEGAKLIDKLASQKVFIEEGENTVRRVLETENIQLNGKSAADLAHEITNFMREVSTTIRRKIGASVLGSAGSQRATTQLTQAIAKAAFNDKKKLKEDCRQALKEHLVDKLNDRELDIISSSLTRYAQIPQLLEDLKKIDQYPVETISSLRFALSRASLTASEEEFPVFTRALVAVEDLEGARGITKPAHTAGSVELKNFAMVFGDGFIGGTKFEGDTNSRPYAEYAVECLERLNLKSPQAKVLKQVLQNAIDLRALSKTPRDLRKEIHKDLREEIHKKLKSLPEGSQRCLFFGGWVDHAIVYEIEKQANGKYAFRVYNLGEGITSHDSKTVKYGSKYSGWIAIADIPERLLFRRSFLANLTRLSSLQKGENNLTSVILPMLGGTRENVDPRIRRYLSPQRSGTCTYRSLQAFFAHSMPEEDYKHFKLEYKLLLLDKYLPNLAEKARKGIPDDDVVAYHESVVEYGVIKRSLERFAHGVDKLSGNLEDSQIKNAAEKITAYQNLLKQLEQNIISYEKNAYSGQMTSIQKGTPLNFLFAPVETLDEPTLNVAKNAVNSARFDSQFDELTVRIDRLNPADANFSRDVQEILPLFRGDRFRTIENYCRGLDALFKKIGSLQTLKSLKYPNPERAFEHFTEIGTELALYRKPRRDQPAGVSYLMNVATYFAIEFAFRQLPDQERILPRDFPSFAREMDFSKLSVASFHDPYWVSFYLECAEMLKESLAYALPRPTSGLSPGSDPEYQLDPKIVDAILMWWDAPAQKELVKKVEESVAADRQEQKKEIDRLTNIYTEMIERDKKIFEEQRKLLANPGKEVAANELVTILKKSLERSQLALVQTPASVHNNKKYWPWDWENNMDRRARASFLFGLAEEDFFKKKIGQDPIPADHPMRKLFDSALTMKYGRPAEGKSEGLPIRFPIFAKRSEKDGSIKLECYGEVATPIWGSRPAGFDFNLYHSLIKDSELYSKLLRPQEDETLVPRSGSRDFRSDRAHTLSEESFKELLSMRQSNIQVDATLAYFNQNSEKLVENDFYLIFHSYLFESDLLLKALRDPAQNKSLVKKLDEFFRNRIEEAKQKEDFSTASKLMRTKSTVQNYINFVSAERAKENLPPLESIFSYDELMPLMQVAANRKYEKHWPMIFQSVVAACGEMGNQSHTEGQLQALLMANVLMKQFPNSVPADPFVLSDVDKAKAFIAHYFSPLGAGQGRDGIDFLNPETAKLLHGVLPTIGEFRQDQNDIIITEDNKLRIAFSSGELASTELSLLKDYKEPARDDILQLFQNLGICPKDTKRTELLGYQDRKCLFVKDVVTTFEYIIHGENVYRKMNIDGKDVYALFQEVSNSIKAQNVDMGYRYLQWAVGNDRYLCDRSTHALIYKMPSTGGIYEIQSNLQVVSPPTAKLFDSFEANACTTFLADPSGKITKISFPRLALSFSLKADEYWECDQQKGWQISEKQFAPHLGPHAGFLVLERRTKEGEVEKKVLLPDWDAQPEKYGKNALNFPLKYDFKVGKDRKDLHVDKGHLVECALIGDRLVPNSLEARLQLGWVYLQKGYQDEAEALLFSSKAEITNRPLTNKERQLLEKIVLSNPSKSVTGRLLSVRLHALYLLERDKTVFLASSAATTENTREKLKRQLSETEDAQERAKIQLALDALEPEIPMKDDGLIKDENKIKRNLMADYLKRLGQVKLLEKHEELLILESLMNPNGANFSFQRRVAELMGAEPIDSPIRSHSGVFISKPELIEGVLVATPPIPVPTIYAKFQYWTSRLRNTFPFDYTSDELDWNELSEYAALISRECSNTKNTSSARDSGLLPMLHYLSTSSNVSINNFAINQLKKVYAGGNDIKLPPDQKRNDKGVDRNAKKVKSRPGSAIKHGVQSLYALGDTCPAEGEMNYLSDLRKQYLDEIATPMAKTEGALFTEGSLEGTDETTKEQFRLMREDLQAAEALEDKAYALKGGQTIDGMREKIVETLTDERQNLAAIEVSITQAVASALTIDPASALQYASKKRQLPTIQELAMLCGRVEGDLLKEAYPELSDDGRAILKNAIKDYLIQKQFVQHLDRAKSQSEEILQVELEGGEPETIAILMNDLGKSLDAKRCYDVDTDPLAMVFLVVESILNIKQRADQVENITRFYQASQNGEEVVQQMIMGAGKTSVLQPILAFLFARPGRLSTVCVPPSLFAEVRQKLSQVLGDSFEQFVVIMPFNRKLSSDESYLKTYLANIQLARKRGAVVLFTPDQKKSILAGWKESLSNENENVNKVLSDILIEFESELAQMDEIDMTMDPDVVYKFPIGANGSIDHEKAEIVSAIVMGLATDDEISKKVNLDFVTKFRQRIDPTYKPEGAQLSADLYEREVKQKLCEITIGILREQYGQRFTLLESKDTEGYIKDCILQSTPYDEEVRKLCSEQEEKEIFQSLGRVDLKAYQCQNEKEQAVVNKELHKSKVREWIRKNFLDEKLRNTLAVCAHTVENVLSKTLFKECGSSYDVDPDSRVYVARPYFAPNSPKPSIPSDCYEQVVYSAQLLLARGFSRSATLDILKNMQILAEKEMVADNTSLIETDAYKEFKRLIGDDHVDRYVFRDKPPAEGLILALQTALNKDQKSLNMFMSDYVFKQISRFAKSISVTQQGSAGISRQSCGYTGTLNKAILTPTMKPRAEKGTDGKTIAAVESKIQSGKAGIRSLAPNDGLYAEQLKKAYASEKDFFVFIDSGNFLKEEANLQVYVDGVLSEIERVGQRPNIRGCIFPDAQGEWLSRERDGSGEWVTIRLRESKLKLNERITIIPSKHETGTNIPQPPTAKALVTIRKGMTIRDTLQSVFRMRQILNAQTVDFVLAKEVQDHVASLLLQAAFENDPYKSLLGARFNELRDQINQLPQSTEVQKAIVNALLEAIVEETEQDWDKKSIKGKYGEVSAAFREKFEPSSSSLWNYLLKNLALDNSEKAWQAGKQRMKEVIEKPIRKTMLHESYTNRKIVYDNLNDLFEQTEAELTFETVFGSREVTASVGIKKEVRRWLNFYARVENSWRIPDAVKNKIKKEIITLYGDKSNNEADVKSVLKRTLESCVNEQDIPSIVKIEGVDSGGEIEVEVEVEAQQEVEIEREIETLVVGGVLREVSYRSFPGGYASHDVVKYEAREITEVLPKSLHNFFSRSIRFSPNLFLSFGEATAHEIGSDLHGAYHLPGRYLLACRDWRWRERYILISHQDASMIVAKAGQRTDARGYSMRLVSFDGNIPLTVEDGEIIHGKNKEIDDDLKKALVQAKLLTCNIRLTKEELRILKEMLGDDVKTARALREMIEKTLRRLPDSAKAYQRSSLHQLLKKMSEG